jgi:hypothetical protein
MLLFDSQETYAKREKIAAYPAAEKIHFTSQMTQKPKKISSFID